MPGWGTFLLKPAANSETIWSLQILRFVAALMVVYVHSMQTVAAVTGSNGFVPFEMIKLGSAGVDIFFVISGFIIATIAPGRGPFEFAQARFFRVVPLYLICSIPPLASALTQPEFGWRWMVSTLFLWPATDQMTHPVLGPAWSLCFEMLFYAAATLVLVNRRWLYVLLIAVAVAFVLRPLGPVFQFVGNPIILEFLFGVVIARAPKTRYGIAALPIGAAALVVSGFYVDALGDGTINGVLVGDDALQRAAVMGIPAALIVYGTLHIKAKPGRLTYLGGASYSLYLTHPGIVSAIALFWWTPLRQPEIMVAIGMVAAVVLAWRVHERVEKPVLKAFRIGFKTVQPVTA